MKLLGVSLATLLLFSVSALAENKSDDVVVLHIICKSQDVAQIIAENLDPTPPKMEELNLIRKTIDQDCLLSTSPNTQGKLVKKLYNGKTVEMWSVHSVKTEGPGAFAVVDK